MSASKRLAALGSALILFGVWTIATWLLEGRIHTLIRSEAVVDRLVYTVVVNILIGLLAASVLVARFAERGAGLGAWGFAGPRRSLIGVAAGSLLGVGLLMVTSTHRSGAIFLSNVFAQVLPTTIAEIIVCWVAVGVTTERSVRSKWAGAASGMLAASAVFAIYHFAHSPPFNTWQMVTFLGAIGLITSVFFFVFRDVYGTIIMHNCLAVIGVSRALEASGSTAPLQVLRIPILVIGTAALALLISLHLVLLRRKQAPTQLRKLRP